jgi:hypothetical protein
VEALKPAPSIESRYGPNRKSHDQIYIALVTKLLAIAIDQAPENINALGMKVSLERRGPRSKSGNYVLDHEGWLDQRGVYYSIGTIVSNRRLR